MFRYLLITLCYFILNLPAWSSQAKIPISIETDIYNHAQKILDGQSILSIEDYSGPYAQRDSVEFILVQKALLLGGSTLEFTFTLGNYDARNIKLLKSGLLLISFDSIWFSQVSEFSKDVYISDPVIRKGEYWAGLYTSVENHKALATKNLDDLKNMSFISNKNWLVDWKTLVELKPKVLIHDEEWLSMAKLVSLKWVDMMLAPFTANYPFSYEKDGYNITAVDGIKVALNDSRHFVISKKHPKGKETYIALQKGLKILRERGTIVKAYKQSGFFNPHVEEWKTINSSFINMPKEAPSQ